MEIYKNKRNGEGEMKYNNRDKYNGNWKDDKREGKKYFNDYTKFNFEILYMMEILFKF